MELDTQDICTQIKECSTSGEQENIFFLYVATPHKPPRGLHKKIVEPFLKENGWQKVSYRNTGFRALYFLRETTDSECARGSLSTGFETSHEVDGQNDVITITSSDEGNDGQPSLPKRRKTAKKDTSMSLSATQRATGDRTELKRKVENFRAERGLSFQVHIVLSRPIDYTSDFAELADSPNSIEF